MTVVATAGHVDHGKSTLIIALTGTDPDRLAEEQARGLTIDIGFAHTMLGDREVSFVDLPGHTRFIKNMLAGVTGCEGCLLVVAADDGWKPQSEEHLRILDVLGIEQAIVALTKIDLVDEARRAEVHADITRRLRSTSISAAPIIEVAAPSGIGLARLRDELTQLVARLPEPTPGLGARLWVDRRFSRRGAGTIVTGTLGGGRISTGDRLVAEPGGAPLRVRRIQIHGRDQPSIGPGQRATLNLTGAGVDEIIRGQSVIAADCWHLTDTVDCSLTVFDNLDHPVGRRGAHLAYFGSGEWPVRVRIIGSGTIDPGSSGSIRLSLPHKLPLVPGDRYVLRDAGRWETVGGGQVLDVDPMLSPSRARPDRDVARVVAERGWTRAEDVRRLTGVRLAPTVGEWVVDPAAQAATIESVASLGRAAMPLGTDIAILDRHQRAVLDAGLVPDARVANGRLLIGPATDALEHHPWVRGLADELFQPPPPAGLSTNEVRMLARSGLVVERDGVYFHRDAIERAAVVVRSTYAGPEGFTVAELRDTLAATRRTVLPLLAELDARGVTRRSGDRRVVVG